MPFLFFYHLEVVGCQGVLIKDKFHEINRKDAKILPVVSQAEGWGNRIRRNEGVTGNTSLI